MGLTRILTTPEQDYTGTTIMLQCQCMLVLSIILVAAGQEHECVKAKVDVFFLVDVSKSIGINEFLDEKKAVKFLITGFDLDKKSTRVGLIKFYRTADLEFGLGQYASRDALLSQDILIRKGKPPAGTRTDLALNMMMDEFEK